VLVSHTSLLHASRREAWAARAQNIFLDGNTSKDSLSVDKKRFVLDTQTGLAIVWNRTRITYTYVLRTEEYDGQGRPDRFASLSFSRRF
jgi:hypothetical protein